MKIHVTFHFGKTLGSSNGLYGSEKWLGRSGALDLAEIDAHARKYDTLTSIFPRLKSIPVANMRIVVRSRLERRINQNRVGHRLDTSWSRLDWIRIFSKLCGLDWIRSRDCDPPVFLIRPITSIL